MSEASSAALERAGEWFEPEEPALQELAALLDAFAAERVDARLDAVYAELSPLLLCREGETLAGAAARLLEARDALAEKLAAAEVKLVDLARERDDAKTAAAESARLLRPMLEIHVPAVPADAGASPVMVFASPRVAARAAGTSSERRCSCGYLVGLSAPEVHRPGCEELARLQNEEARRAAKEG